MNTKRLLKMAEFVATLAAKDMQMRHWNTCALGRAAAAGIFKGFKLWVDEATFDTDIEFGRTHHFDAAAKLFGIKQGEVVDLFGAYDISPEQLAHDIRAFVRNPRAEYANVSD